LKDHATYTVVSKVGLRYIHVFITFHVFLHHHRHHIRLFILHIFSNAAHGSEGCAKVEPGIIYDDVSVKRKFTWTLRHREIQGQQYERVNM